jgi:cytochrome c556
MKKIGSAVALLALFGATVAFAGPVEDRQALMKDFNTTSAALRGVAAGTTPFDAAAVKTQLQTLVDGAAKLPGMFPAGSQTTTGPTPSLAQPAVWSDSAGFAAAAAKFGADAKAAQAATDTASFAAAWQTASADCNACHMTYRARPQRPAGAGGPGGGPGGAGGPPPGTPPAAAP